MFNVEYEDLWIQTKFVNLIIGAYVINPGGMKY